jgi:hypothetical protein
LCVCRYNVSTGHIARTDSYVTNVYVYLYLIKLVIKSNIIRHFLPVT